MKSKKILVPLLSFFVILSGILFVVPSAHAQTTNSNGNGNFFSGLVNFIAQKFGLDKTQVQTAITDYKTQHKASITPKPTLTQDQITTIEKTRYDKLVTSGKITAAQETAILSELTLLRSKYTFNKNQTPDVRKVQMQAMQEDIKTFATAQGIDPSLLRFGGSGIMRERGFRGKGGPWNITITPTPTP